MTQGRYWLGWWPLVVFAAAVLSLAHYVKAQDAPGTRYGAILARGHVEVVLSVKDTLDGRRIAYGKLTNRTGRNLVAPAVEWRAGGRRVALAMPPILDQTGAPGVYTVVSTATDRYPVLFPDATIDIEGDLDNTVSDLRTGRVVSLSTDGTATPVLFTMEIDPE